MSRVRFIHACAILSIGTPLPPRVAFYGRRALYGRRINGKKGAARGSSTDPLWGTADFLRRVNHPCTSSLSAIKVDMLIRAQQRTSLKERHVSDKKT